MRHLSVDTLSFSCMLLVSYGARMYGWLCFVHALEPRKPAVFRCDERSTVLKESTRVYDSLPV